MNPRYSIVLPCYNEEGTLPSLFARFGDVLNGRSDYEVVFVNNGSVDDSATVFARELARPGREWAQLVTVPKNRGYGFGILAGLRAARGDFLGWTHADSQYDPAIIPAGFAKLVEAGESQRFIQGRRICRNWFDAFFTAGMSAVASLALAERVRDVNAQPKLFPRGFLSLMQNPPEDFSLDLYALYLARRHGYQVAELPVVFGQRKYGEAKGGGSWALKWKLTRRTWKFIFEMRRAAREGQI